MSDVSLSVIGIKPPDEKWKKMKAVYDACVVAESQLPTDVENFFGGEEPDKKGVIVEIEKTKAVSKYSDEMIDGFEVDLTKLPPDVKIIRFTANYD